MQLIHVYLYEGLYREGVIVGAWLLSQSTAEMFVGGHTSGTRSVVSQSGWFLIAGGGVYAQRHSLIEESPQHILGYSSYL